ncbi:hypothetical protein [Dongia sp.]|uniref:hypothetical protein n=1 Tax=Dongia sp. TaxID=1977262 RepID=UPI0035AFBA8A
MDMLYGILPLVMLGLYLWLQIRTLRRYRHGWWWAALLPAIAMALATLVGLVGGLQGANLAPLWFFLTLPVSLLYLGGLTGFKAIRDHGRRGISGGRAIPRRWPDRGVA